MCFIAPCVVSWLQSLCCTHGVAVAIFVLCMVSWPQSLYHVWCQSQGCCTTCGLRLPSLHHVWCHGHGCFTVCRLHSPFLHHGHVYVPVFAHMCSYLFCFL